METDLTTSSSVMLLDDLWLSVEDPLTMQRIDEPVTLSCMHTLDKDSAILLYGLDGEKPVNIANPDQDPICSICRVKVTYWKKDLTVKNLMEKVDQLDTILKTERAKNLEEITRLKAAERHLSMEIARRDLSQKLYKTVPEPQNRPIYSHVIPEKLMETKKIVYSPDNSVFGSLMLCFGGYGSCDNDKWY